MTDEELLAAMKHEREPGKVLAVAVTANDYGYEGWVVGMARKRSGAMRAIVEDRRGRLFIHNAGQLSLRDEHDMRERIIDIIAAELEMSPETAGIEDAAERIHMELV